MATNPLAAAVRRNANKPVVVKGNAATRAAGAEKIAKRATKQGMAAGMSFKKSGRSASYRGAAGKVMRQGGGAINAHKAGMKAEQAYMG